MVVECVWSMFCYAVLNVLSSFAIISLEKRELVAYFKILVLLTCVNMSCVSSPRGTMVGLQYVISWSY